jgi:phage replication-related protein YjqB (UPF0714/DUF867 family)
MFETSEIRRTLEREIGLVANNIANRVRDGLSYKIFSIILACLFVVPQFAVAVDDNAFGGLYATEVPGTEGMTEMQVILTLKQDIQKLDEEILQCNRKRKGWTAATIIGGVGVVGTGVAALVQNSNRKEKKAEIEKVNKQIGNTEQQIKSMNKGA